MRCAVALAALMSVSAATVASAETWKSYTPNATSLGWFYDADYSYRDRDSGRVVVMQAVGKVGANPKVGPGAPGAADGVGSVVALDCRAGNLILMGGYKPGEPLNIPGNWRTKTPKKFSTDEDKALAAAVCPGSGLASR